MPAATRLTCVADTGVVNLNAHLVRLRGCDLNVLNDKVLASLPGDSGLACNGLCNLSRQSVPRVSQTSWRGVSSVHGGVTIGVSQTYFTGSRGHCEGI